MTRASLKRALTGVAIGIVIAGALAPFLPLPFLRPGIERALTRRLGRRVEIGEVSLSLFSGPGFSVSGVTIHEDPRAGIEPFVYAPNVDARVDLLGLLAGQRGFSSLRFSDATLNLVRTRAGEWNFQYLLGAPLSGVPSIHLRGSRVNLKFAQSKAVLYFDDADVDVTPGERGSLDLRFAGAPARTDRPAQSFAQLVVRGSWVPTAVDRPLNLKVEWEPSSFDGLAKLFGRSWFDLQGQVSLDAQLSGKPDALAVNGEVQLDGGRRSDFLPSRDAKWTLAYRGTLDLLAEKLELENVVDANAARAAAADVPPLSVGLQASELLTAPQWQASVALNDVSVALVTDAARRIGAPFPAKLSADGKLSGTLNYDADAGLRATLEVRDAALVSSDSPDAPAVRAASVPIVVGQQTVSVGPCSVSVNRKSARTDERTAEKPETQSAQVEGSYKFDGSAAADFKITTRALDGEGLRAFAAAPLLGQAAGDSAAADRGAREVWRGSLRYQRAGEAEGAWTGDYSVENALVAIDGLADPVRIQFASVSASPGRLAVTRMKAKAGSIAFTGEYHYQSKIGNAASKNAPTADAGPPEGPAAKATSGGAAAGDPFFDPPHKFKLQVAEANVAELERLWKPTLARGGGFIERTLRLGASPAPDWLAKREAEGTLSIAALIVGERKLAVDAARVLWDGASLRVSGVAGRFLDPDAEGSTFPNTPDSAAPNLASANRPALKGELSIDLAEAAPRYRATGKLTGLPYKGGRLDFEGQADGVGEGLPLLASLRAAGTLSGRSIAFSPSADFRDVSGHFQAQMQGTSWAWKFSELEITQGADLYLGEGSMGADGKIILDLTNRGKQVRYTGALVSATSPP